MLYKSSWPRSIDTVFTITANRKMMILFRISREKSTWNEESTEADL